MLYAQIPSEALLSEGITSQIDFVVELKALTARGKPFTL